MNEENEDSKMNEENDNTEQQYQQAVEEFGEEAHKRFYAISPSAYLECVESNRVIEDLLVSWKSECRIREERFGHIQCNMPESPILIKPLVELYDHGVTFYGFGKEVKMWEFKGHGGDWQAIPDKADYYDMYAAINASFYQHRRKPFNGGIVNEQE